MAPGRVALVALLAWSAGCVDTIGYVALGGVFTSHLTGNTAAIAVSLVSGRDDQVVRRLVVVCAFVIGVALATIVLEHSPHGPQIVLAGEATLLAAAGLVLVSRGTALRSELGAFVAAALGVAMGIQNIALARGPGRRGHTTHLTGPVTDFVAELTCLVTTRMCPRIDAKPVATYAARVAGFVTGAFSGVALFLACGPWALLVASAAVVTGALVMSASSTAWRIPG